MSLKLISCYFLIFCHIKCYFGESKIKTRILQQKIFQSDQVRLESAKIDNQKGYNTFYSVMDQKVKILYPDIVKQDQIIIKVWSEQMKSQQNFIQTEIDPQKSDIIQQFPKQSGQYFIPYSMMNFKRQPVVQKILVKKTKKTPSFPQFCLFRRSSNQTEPIISQNIRQVLVQTNYGFSMYVDSKDNMVSKTIMNTGTWEPQYINLIGHIVKKGDYVLNLGSQSGLEALVMGKIIGPTGRLFIFQPYSFSNYLITKSIQHNNLNKITTIYKYGASDKVAKAMIMVGYMNTGGSEIEVLPAGMPDEQAKSVNRKWAFGQSQQVQIQLVDNLLPKDVKLNFALIDVQKMQVKALKGMKKVIERSPNLIIMVQWQYALNPRRNRQQTIQLLKWLGDKGYKAYKYTGGFAKYCMVGHFYWYKSIESLVNISSSVDIFFFPPTVQLPQ